MRRELLIHPGQILREEFLKPHGLSVDRLAYVLNLSVKHVIAILDGQWNIGGGTAIILGRAFGTSAEFWLNLQARYELDLAKLEVGEELVWRAEELARELNVYQQGDAE